MTAWHLAWGFVFGPLAFTAWVLLWPGLRAWITEPRDRRG